MGRLHRRLRGEDPRLPGHHRLLLGRVAGDSKPRGEGLPREAPDHRRRMVRRLPGSDGGGDQTTQSDRQGRRRIARQGWIAGTTDRSGSALRMARTHRRICPEPSIQEDPIMSSVEEPISLSTRAPALELHEIQATILRPRPAPYFGTHMLFRVDDTRAGRAFLRRLIPHVDSAAGWWSATEPWLSVGITYAGLEALGVPQD